MRRVIAIVLVLAGAALFVPVGAGASCHGNVPPCIAGVGVNDRQLIVYGSTYYPNPLDVRGPATVYLQNFDGITHTVTAVGCIDPALGPCPKDQWGNSYFDKRLLPSSRLDKAGKLTIGRGYIEAGTWNYRCTEEGHTETGVLVVS